MKLQIQTSYFPGCLDTPLSGEETDRRTYRLVSSLNRHMTCSSCSCSRRTTLDSVGCQRFQSVFAAAVIILQAISMAEGDRLRLAESDFSWS